MERSVESIDALRRSRPVGGLSRLRLVAALDLGESLRRPLFLIFAVMMGWNGWLMAEGEWIFRSNSTSLGGQKAFVDSEFQIAYVFALITYFMVSFFVAVAAGMPLIRDAEHKVGELLHATPLRPGEYVWGKFLASFLACLAAVAVLPFATGVFSHLLPDAGNPDMYGPFVLLNYVRPFLVFLVPAVLFAAGMAFAIGAFTGRPILVFLFPIGAFLLCENFFWRWRPPDLDPAVDAFLCTIDPSGFRWLRQTWLTVDRGLAVYNHQPVGYSASFLLSRLGFALAGLLLVDLARRRVAGRLHRSPRVRREAAPGIAQGLPAAASASLSALAMRSRPPGFLAGAWSVLRFELRELRSQPGLYIFIPAILLFLFILYRETYGYFFSPLLLTPGVAAMRGMAFLLMGLGLLFLFYTVESLERERTTRVAPLIHASPVLSGAIVAGKVMASLVVLVIALVGAFLVAALSIAGQGQVPVEVRPFLVVWGLLLTPTLIVWIAFVAAILALTKSRSATYGVSFGALLVTAFLFIRGHMNWVGNWILLGATNSGTAVPWTDMGGFDIDGTALVLNRFFVLSLAALFGWTAGRFLHRRDRDRLHPVLPPAARRRTVLTFALLALPPLVLGFTLWAQVNQGFQGAAVEKQQKDYWRKNLATWTSQPLPYVTRVEMDVAFEPAARSFEVSGFYDLQNQKDKNLYWFPVTGGIAWDRLAWTLNGRAWTPEERSLLHIFRLPKPLAPGESVRLGFRYRGTMLLGISKNGGSLERDEFVLPSGILLTGRNPDFVPVIGFNPRIGVDEDNRSEPQIYPPHHYEGVTDTDLDRSAFTQRLRITAPAEYTINSTGVLTSDVVKAGRRTVVWESDYPLRVFNVAAGRWAVKRGPGTAVFYHPGHPYNVDSLLEALNGARRFYASWYAPYPWRELRLNEFPAFTEGARGNATNIFFSEGAGFLVQRLPGNDMAFSIAAHEAAHQWWGHIMAPGEGPGGIVLAEGAANFATLMLLEEMRGLQARIFYAARIEETYGENRMPSTEKPLAETLELAGRPGDVTVIYDKGAWALWMLYRQMGKNDFLAGVQEFFRIYHGNPDHPVIEDFVAVMRPHAKDKKGFDDLVQQWFFAIVTPEYHLDRLHKQRLPNGQWEATAWVMNAGTGRMPVEVAATQGERFDDKGGISPDYRDARTTVVLGAGEAREVRIRCAFEPEQVVVDPDANVLQLQRKAAAAKL